MNTRSSLVASVATASLLIGVADACAAPSTVYLEGTTASYFDDFSGADVPGNVGQPFSIKVTVDVANGTQFSTVVPGESYRQSFGIRGCRSVVEGLCTEDFGAQLPVVTDYSVLASFAPVDGLRPIPTGDYLWDLTSRSNRSSTGGSPMDVYAIERHQEQCTRVAADPEGGYEEKICVGTFFWVYLSTTVNTMFGSDVMDLDKAPNLADVPPGYVGFTYVNFERVDGCLTVPDQEPVCATLAYFPGSVAWTGTVTSVAVVGQGGPTTKDACTKNGWKAFGFKNQGQCVSYVNHLP
jgi:hypothetical protein